MSLSKQAIKEFKEIYYREFGERISDEDAREKGERLISLFKVIYHPIPKKNREEFLEKHCKYPENS